ncbi:alpha-L-fucosidase [Verrucomicrobiota bacterium]
MKTNKMIRIVMLMSLILVLCVSCRTTPEKIVSSKEPSKENMEERDKRMKWWREARFGMFIHWGTSTSYYLSLSDEEEKKYSDWPMLHGKVPLAEYRRLAKLFNPVKYDPDAWVRMAKDAGMKYIVITSKHHDGFALFDSKVTDWDVVDATPYGKDLLKPLVKACQKHDMKLGFYYSQAQDWYHAGGSIARGGTWDPAQKGDFLTYIRNIAVPQVREILNNYGDVAVMWWDTPRGMTPKTAGELAPLLSVQPHIIQNNRLIHGENGDFTTPEQRIPARGLGYDWETCMTMSARWWYRRTDNAWKSEQDLIRKLVDIASKGGNFLLNVGPTAEGELPEPARERMKAIGKWMKVNGESIYGTQASPFRKLPWGRCTVKAKKNGDTTLYLHVFDWPSNGRLSVPGLKNRIRSARLLRSGKSLNIQLPEGDWPILHVPKKAPDTTVSVIAVDIGGKPDIDLLHPSPDASGVIELMLNMAELEQHGHGGKSGVLKDKKDGRDALLWKSARAKVLWEFKVDKSGLYSFKALCRVPYKTIPKLMIRFDEQKPCVLTDLSDRTYKAINSRSVHLKAGVHRVELSRKYPEDGWPRVHLRVPKIQKEKQAL